MNTLDKPVLNVHSLTAATHAVFARTADGKRVRVSDPLWWRPAQQEWERLNALRRGGRMPHVQHFEVRETTDPNYADAPLSLDHRTPVVARSRGYGDNRHTGEQKAARAAWNRFAPTFRSWWDKRSQAAPDVRTGVQGTGGWFYYPNGETAAQGLDGLARIARVRHLIVRGENGRWYVLDNDS